MKILSFNMALGKPKESKLYLALVPALKEKRTQQYTTLILSLVTISFFTFFAISPTLGTIADLQRQLDDNNFVNQQMQKKIANISSLQVQYVQLQSQLDPVFAAIPQDPAMGVFVGQLHTLASQQGVTLSRIQTYPVDISTTTLTTKYLTYAFSIEGQGTFDQTNRLLVALSGLNRLMTFDEITFSNVGVVGNAFRMNVRGKVYFKGVTL